MTAKDPAGFEFRDERPTVGGFIVYGSPDHRGFATKLSGAWQTTVVRYTRGSYFETESGSGKAAISGSSGRAEISYGFAPRHEVRITPFAAVRRTITGRSSYREDQTDTVLSPLSFLPFNMQSSTAIAGLRVAGMVSNDFGVMLGMSVERDLAQHRSMMNASSSSPDIPVMNLSLGNALRATALAANLGLSWEVAPKQYFTAQANLRGQLGLSSPSLTTLLGYQVSF